MCAKVQLKQIKFKQKSPYTLGFNQNGDPKTIAKVLTKSSKGLISHFSRDFML